MIFWPIYVFTFNPRSRTMEYSMRLTYLYRFGRIIWRRPRFFSRSASPEYLPIYSIMNMDSIAHHERGCSRSKDYFIVPLRTSMMNSEASSLFIGPLFNMRSMDTSQARCVCLNIAILEKVTDKRTRIGQADQIIGYVGGTSTNRQRILEWTVCEKNKRRRRCVTFFSMGCVVRMAVDRVGPSSLLLPNASSSSSRRRIFL